MRIDSDEYLKLLFNIQSNNPPSLAILAPGYEPLFEVDLNTRTINAPQILSVEQDHRAETVFFKTNRYYDGIDLVSLNCIIQYVNANGKGSVYVVPYFDADTYHQTNEILFPWVIDQHVTEAAGIIKYSIRFFKLDSAGHGLIYNLNTLPTTGEVQEGISMNYEETYQIVELNPGTYRYNQYYVKNSITGEYELATSAFDASETYYQRTTLDSPADTDLKASFLEEIANTYNGYLSECKLTWNVI